MLGRSGDHLTLTWGSDAITIENYFSGNYSRIEKLVFADGTNWSYFDLASRLTQTGSSDNDNWTGLGDQSNRMYGMAGNDVLSGGWAADTLDGGDGDDRLYSSAGEDTLIGGNGNDILDGGHGNDSLTGGNGNDILDGGSDNDSLTGGKGNDYLSGGYGNDTYFFNQGDGVDTIRDYDYTTSNIDTLQLGTGIDAAATVLTRSGDHLTLTWGSDAITFENYFSGNDYRIEKLVFADGTNWSCSDLASRLTQSGSSNSDNWTGLGDQSNRMYGMAGNDVLSGGWAADTVLERSGDHLTLTWDSDAITIANYFSGTYYRIEKLVFADGTNWSYSDLASRLTQKGSSNSDNWTGLGDQTNRVYGMAGNDALSGGQLADTLDGGDGDDRLSGGAGEDTLMGGNGNDSLDGGDGNDSLTGGKGNDYLSGGYGNDTYFFNQGDGVDTIRDFDYTSSNADLLQFGSDITSDRLWFSHVGNNLEISVIGTSDKTIIENWYAGSAAQIERISAADGLTLVNKDVERLVQAMSGFSAPPAGTTVLPPPQRTALAPVLASNWH
ncbi:calcium-binding protein [Herbaspirillum sp. DW155]|uniref:calcium-binding protein n=1 Tax=Herbaspirillum sp. DW155 TaxID=3095609 RepID=UPI00308E25C0|nr:calcium-binding protein [Herbaspirillum sp. DW155]